MNRTCRTGATSPSRHPELAPARNVDSIPARESPALERAPLDLPPLVFFQRRLHLHLRIDRAGTFELDPLQGQEDCSGAERGAGAQDAGDQAEEQNTVGQGGGALLGMVFVFNQQFPIISNCNL